jgi:hypothetical protein
MPHQTALLMSSTWKQIYWDWMLLVYGIDRELSTTQALAGNIIDKMFKDAIQKDPCLNDIVKTTPKGKFGPDVYSNDLHYWWDLTTPDQWKTGNRNKYFPQFGEGEGDGLPAWSNHRCVTTKTR